MDSILKFDYNKTMRQADELTQIAEDLKSAASGKLVSAKEAIKGSWTGETAAQYLQHLDETKALLDKRAKELTALAANIRKAARALKEADDTAKDAVGRSGGGSGGGGGSSNGAGISGAW